MSTPAISLVAYECRDKSLVFVKVPNERGRFMLVNRCVVEVACPLCGAAKGEPCKRRGNYHIETHRDRRLAAKALRGSGMLPVPNDQVGKPHVKLLLNKPIK